GVDGRKEVSVYSGVSQCALALLDRGLCPLDRSQCAAHPVQLGQVLETFGGTAGCLDLLPQVLLFLLRSSDLAGGLILLGARLVQLLPGLGEPARQLLP